jgi:hypothetical protein
MNSGQDQRVSTPKGLYLLEAGEGSVRSIHRRRSPRFLAPRNPSSGKGQQTAIRLAGLSVSEIAANPDVVQVAQRVLECLEATHEPLPAPGGSLSRKDILEELTRVSQLLGVNPQLAASPSLTASPS